MQQSRQKLLLTIVVVLGCIKFVILPVQLHINELTTQLQDENEKLVKRKLAIREVELMREQEAQLEENLASLKGQFQTGPESALLQLTFQKKLEALAREEEVTLTNISWPTTINGSPEIAELDIKYEAPLKNLMRFHSNLKSAEFNVVTDELFAAVSYQRLHWKKLGQAKGTLKLRIFYLVESR